MMYRNTSTDTLAIETATAVVRVAPGAEIAIAPSRAQHYLDLGLLAVVDSAAVVSVPEPAPKPRARRLPPTPYPLPEADD